MRQKGSPLLVWWNFLRPPIVGAAFLSAYVALRILASAAGGRFAKNGDEATDALLFAAGSGAACGLVYSLLGRPLRGHGVVGNYLAGIVCVLPYFTFLFLLSPELSAGASYRDPAWWLPVLILSTIVGVFVGREFHEKDNLFRPDAG